MCGLVQIHLTCLFLTFLEVLFWLFGIIQHFLFQGSGNSPWYLVYNFYWNSVFGQESLILQQLFSIACVLLPQCFLTQTFQFSSVTQLCPTLCEPMDCSMPGCLVHHQLPEFTQTQVHLVLCHALLLLPSIFPNIRVFSTETDLCIRWPKYWSFSFSISPPSEYSGLISYRMDWLDLLAVHGTLKSLLQHHS